MALDPARLTFPSLRVKVEEPLGSYYQDLSPAIAVVETGFHGPADDAGVALKRRTDVESVYDAIIIAQYAIALVERSLADQGPGPAGGDLERLRAQADWLEQAQESSGDLEGFWLQRFDNSKYPRLRAPWVSALAQGQGVSALLRAHVVLDDERYAVAAEKAYRAMLMPIGEGGVAVSDGDDLWFEEYPLDPPLHVLNGAIYALWGVLDYARFSGDAGAWSTWRRGWATLERELDGFDTGYWSRYDHHTPELASPHYHENIHIPQLEALADLTGSETFARTAERWRGYLRSPVSKLRRRLEGRRRWRLTKRLIGE